MTTPSVVDHFFRHEYGKLVATLSCQVGVQHVADVEDAVQSAMMSATERWSVSGQPENPSAWLFRAAQNNLLGELRQRARRRRLLKREFSEDSVDQQLTERSVSDDAEDDLLRLLFVCCDDAIPVESQLVFALKTLCGFDVREISLRLFMSEANVYKRLTRARNRLREVRPDTDDLTHGQFVDRIPSVHKVLYLLFTEGHLSSDAEIALRNELCVEAIRLTSLLANHRAGQLPETFALLALMHLHSARMPGRTAGDGGLLLLEEQNREKWNRDQIREGLQWLAKSAEGEAFTRYHAEAGIAAEHCLAPSIEETRWDRIAECYELLERSTQSPLHRLNRAVAVAEWLGPSEGLKLLVGSNPPTWLAGSYLFSAVLSDLYRRSGNIEDAERYREIALKSAPSQPVKDLLSRRLRCGRG